MTVTLFTLDGTRMETDRVLEVSADWQAGSPAAQFSAVLPGENWPEELVTVRWKDDSGFTLFEGYPAPVWRSSPGAPGAICSITKPCPRAMTR